MFAMNQSQDKEKHYINTALSCFSLVSHITSKAVHQSLRLLSRYSQVSLPNKNTLEVIRLLGLGYDWVPTTKRIHGANKQQK
jgi:hypothetical protein